MAILMPISVSKNGSDGGLLFVVCGYRNDQWTQVSWMNVGLCSTSLGLVNGILIHH